MRKNFLLMMFAILLLGGCKKDKEVRIYTITEKTPTVDVAVTSVSIRGYYYGYPSDLKSVTVAYTQNSDYSSASTILAENHNVYGADDYYYARLIDLEPGTTYYYYCIFDTGYGSAEGKQWSFTTKSVSATAVTTSSVSNITQTTATCGGNVTSDGGAAVTARGVCWGTSQDPTVSNSHTTDGTGTGSFTSSITGLTASTTYYVRAYATNSKGTSYGEQKSFTTQSGGGTSGCFSVSSTTTVEFAPGNLYWDGSAFRFEANQWSFADTWNASHVSHFKWSDAANAVTGDQTYSGDLFCDSNFTVTGDSHTWRTLSKDEWVYLINTRTGNRFAKARVSGVQGLLIFPDNYSGTTSGNGIAAVNTTNAAFPTSDIPSATWTSMESAGVVFLPAAGYRLGTSLDVVGSYGLYWSSTCSNSNDAYYMYFKSGSVYLQDYDPRYYGYSVRLVYGSQSVSVPTVTTASVSNITQTTATCGGSVTSDGGGSVTSDGGAAVTARGVCWSTSQNPTVSNSHTTDGSGTGSFTSSITGLTANTTYYVRAYATNSAGTSYGEQKSFTTLQSISVPTVTTSSVSNITQTTATCGGEVTSDGGAAVTARGVCWSTSQNPTVSDSHTADGSGTGSFTSSITGLTANTTYYVRAYATNSAGTSYGEQRTFTTQSGGGGGQTQTFTVNGVTFEMVAVEGGTFTMGGTPEQGSDAYDNEFPTHSVTLSDYCIGKFEVTQELWLAVMGSWPGTAPSVSYGLGDDYPAYYVSWNDCQEFITELNQLTGRTFRLPTEAEWEYAARGGNMSGGYKYSGSNSIGEVAWYDDNSGSKTHTVGTKSPNELGIYDMSGNVWEWCQDWCGSYSSGSQTNPQGPSSGSYRVGRGGSCHFNAGFCRVSYRDSGTPSIRLSNLGFRVVLIP